MELVEDLKEINKRLIEFFGTDTVTGQPIWRIVFSEDQFEKRKGTYDDFTSGGIYLRTVTEVRLVPKYKQWIHSKYVLERLVAVPDQNIEELPTVRMSYEVLWVFEDKDGNYLPPKWEAAQFIIETVLAAQHGTHNLKKYIDNEDSQEASLKMKSERVDKIIEELWGDQSSLHGRTAAGDMVALGNRDFEIKN
jgi:hypothetical protein